MIEADVAQAVKLGGELLARLEERAVADEKARMLAPVVDYLHKLVQANERDRPERERIRHYDAAVDAAKGLPAELVGQLRRELEFGQRALQWIEAVRAR